MTNVLKTKEQQLIERLQQGDENALSVLYKEYWEMMYLAAFNLVKNKHVCEDLVQEVFISLWKKRQNLVIKISLRGYLYTSVVYKVYDHFRKNKSKINVELVEGFDKRIEQSTPESKLIYSELIEFINISIEELPEKCKLVFKLSRDEQLSHKEISEKLNISVRTVEGHVLKAIKHIKAEFGKNMSMELVVFIIYKMFS